jgi:uncharacterized protein YbaP (TraB family)
MSSKTWLLFLCAVGLSVVSFAQSANAQHFSAAKDPASDPTRTISPPPGPEDEDFGETPAPADAVDIEGIVVVGRQPGPGLWKVRKGDHVLWILGTQTPLPKRMEWDSAYVQRRVAESQEVLLAPTASIGSDLGFFRNLALIPSALKARKNPDDKTLSDIVPPEQYARWLALKKRYIGNDRGVEQWRPVFAALELYTKAIERSGMRLDTTVDDLVKKAAKNNKVPVSTPKVEVKIKDPKAALKAFSQQPLEDMECFTRTLDRIEGDLGTMALRANAWAQGDLEQLRDLPFRSQFSACSNALTGNEIAKKLGFSDIQQRIETTWLNAAEAALSKNASTFAIMPVGLLLPADGYLAKLAAKGYVIEGP